MGLSLDSIKFLAQARHAGIPFDRVLTLGRQYIVPSQNEIIAVLSRYGCWPPPQGEIEFKRAMQSSIWRFDSIARALGAKIIDSSDISDYEGSSLVHDLNEPVSPDWHQKYDVVIDGGTLEHVFNFPTAISNCMNLTRVGGHVFLFTPINNYCGHGFYQFSPELFYRVFSKENGFQIRRMVALAETLAFSKWFGIEYPFVISGRWYDVPDPNEIRSRVTLLNHDATILMVCAEREAAIPLFQSTPQQSDYVAKWTDTRPTNDQARPQTTPGILKILRDRLPESFYRTTLPRLAWFIDPLRHAQFRRRHSFKNRRMYRKSTD